MCDMILLSLKVIIITYHRQTRHKTFKLKYLKIFENPQYRTKGKMMKYISI